MQKSKQIKTVLYRIIILFLVIATSFGINNFVTSISTNATDNTALAASSGLRYTYVDERGYQVSSGDCTVADIIVASTYNDGTHGELPVFKVADEGFKSYSGLKSITLPDSIKIIGAMAFANNTAKFSTITMPGVEQIQSEAFYNCWKLNCTLPETLKTIGDIAFFGVEDALATITIPASVETIGVNPFAACDLLSQINVDGNNPNFSSVNDVLFNKDKTRIISYPSAKADTSYSIPNSVLTIGGYTFYETKASFASITVPSTVTSIERRAFRGAKEVKFYRTTPAILDSTEPFVSATVIKVPAASLSAYKSAANWSTYASQIEGFEVEELQYTYVDERGYKVSKGSFTDINIIIEETYNDGTHGELPVFAIDDNAFLNYNTLTSIIMPDSITHIGDNAFSGCVNLSSINLPDGLIEIGDNAFSDCNALTVINIPGSVASIGTNPFKSCDLLQSININSSNPNFESIGGVLFNNLKTRLISYPTAKNAAIYNLPYNVITIDDYAFYEAVITWIRVTGPVEIIGSQAFRQGTKTKIQFYSSTPATMNTNAVNGNTALLVPLSREMVYRTAWPDLDVQIETFDDSGLEYTYVDSRGYEVSGGTCNSNSVVVVASEYNDGIHGNLPVFKVAANGFSSPNEYDFAIVLPNSITEIGQKAFYEADDIVFVTIPSSVMSIGERAFYGCLNLKLEIDSNNPNFSTNDAGTVLFNKDKTQLIAYFESNFEESYIIPNTVTTIADYAFGSNTDLVNLTIPNNVVTIGSFAFYGCEMLAAFDAPASLKSIGSFAFYGCKMLAAFDAPASLKSIGDYVFNYCNNLMSVNLSSGLESIGIQLFFNCNSLTTINIDSGNLKFSSIDGVLFNKAQTKIIAYPEGKVATSYNIPAGVEIIGNNAFIGSKFLNVTIPSSVTNIEYDAFKFCSNLISINLPKNIITIGNSVFAHCSALTEIKVNRKVSGITTLGTNAFGSTSSLPEGFKIFVYNSSVNAYKVADGWSTYAGYIEGMGSVGLLYTYVDERGYEVSHGTCTDSDIEIMTTYDDGTHGLLPVFQIARCGFQQSDLISINIPDSIKIIGELAFHETALTNVTIPGNVEIIGLSAFMECINLSSITLGNGIKTIQPGAFGACSITTINIPSSVENISAPFVFCYNLTTINVDNDNAYFSSADGILFNKNQTKIITYPAGKTASSYTILDGVTDIDAGAFASSTLTEIIMPEGLKTVGQVAFAGTGITEIIIPESVISIDNGAFEDCANLTEVKVISSVPFALGSDVFGVVENLPEGFKILVPGGSVIIDEYKAADGWSTYADYIESSQIDITVTANVHAKIYGDEDPTFTYTVTKDGQPYEVTLSGALSREAGENVNTYAIEIGTLTSENPDYNITFVSANFAITAKTLTISGAGSVNKTYDGSDSAISLISASNYSLAGRVGEDVINLTITTAVFNDANAATGKTVVVNFSGVDNANYSLTAGSFTLNYCSITAKTLAISGAGSVSKTYDGSESAMSLITGDNYILTGIVGEEAVNLVITAAAFNNENAGTGKIVVVSFSGVDNSNYLLIGGSFTLNNCSITAKSLTISKAGSVNKTYDGSDDALEIIAVSNYILTGILEGDTVNLTIASAAFNNADAGTNKTVTVYFSGVDNSNYFLNAGSFELANCSISAKALTISAKGTFTKIYDGNANAAITNAHYNAAGVVGSDNIGLSWANAVFDSQNVADAEVVTVSGLTVTNGNYVLSNDSFNISASITRKDITISGAGNIIKTYDGSAAAVIGSANYTFVGVIEGDEVNLVSHTANFNSKNADTASFVSVSGLGIDNSNYNLTTTEFVISNSQINPKQLTVVWGQLNFQYDGSAKVPTATVNTGIAGETLTVQVAVTGEPAVNVGEYAVTASINNLNYTLTDYENNMIISATVLTITWTNNSFEYNKTVQKPTATVLIDGIATALEVSTDGGINVGTYTATATIEDGYALDNPTFGYNVFAKEITIIGIGSVSKIYDGLTDATSLIEVSNYSAGGLISGDSLTLSFSADFNNKNVEFADTVTVNVTDIGNLNYVLSSASFTVEGSITAKEVSVIWGETSFVYNKLPQYPSASAETGVSGETLQITVSASQGEALNAGTYDAIASINNANYILQNTGHSFEIARKEITVFSAGTVTKVYNGQTGVILSQSDYIFDGVAEGDKLTLNYDANFNSKNVTEANLVTVQSLSINNGNYLLTTNSFTVQGSITPKQLTVNWDGTTFTYNKTQQAPSATVETGIDGETLTVSVAGGAVDAGSYSATATNSNTNYTLTNNVTAFTIAPKELTVTGSGNISKIYDGSTSAQITEQNYLIAGVINGDQVNLTYEARFNDPNVTLATHVIAENLSVDNTNYAIANEQFIITGEINVKRITIKADEIKKTEGDQDPELTYKVEGLVEGDTLNGQLGRTGGNEVGTYDIIQGTLTSANNPNYEIDYVSAKLIIEQRMNYTMLLIGIAIALIVLSVILIIMGIVFRRRKIKLITLINKQNNKK